MERAGITGNPKENTSVTAVISPYLEKRGNADGGAYDESMVLTKAMVVCDI